MARRRTLSRLCFDPGEEEVDADRAVARGIYNLGYRWFRMSRESGPRQELVALWSRGGFGLTALWSWEFDRRARRLADDAEGGVMLRQRVASFVARREIAAMAGVVVLSWLGNYIHNLADLPQLTLLSPENSLVALATLGLFLAWWLLPRLRRVTTALLFGLGLTHLLGGAVLSVLPIGLFPFDPEQSLRHYLFHLLYGAMQLPLIALAYARRRAGGQG